MFLGGGDKRKIGDFGEARVEHKEYLMSQLSSQDPTNNAVGTIPFVAPEVLTGGRPTKQSDVYSFAMLLTELLWPSRTNPWADDCKVPCITSYILEKKRPTLPSDAYNISPLVLERFSQLIRRCWNEDPHQKPTIKEVISELQSVKELIEHGDVEKTEKEGEIAVLRKTANKILFHLKSSICQCIRGLHLKPSGILLCPLKKLVLKFPENSAQVWKSRQSNTMAPMHVPFSPRHSHMAWRRIRRELT